MIVALLCFYDETERTLERLIVSLARCRGVGRIVALDGAYELFPHGGRASAPKQRRAIRKAAEHAGIEARIFVPERKWHDEMEKRSALFEYGEMDTQPNDWLFVVDADYELGWCPPDLADLLAAHTEPYQIDAAEVSMQNIRGELFPGLPPIQSIRSLFRSRLGLRVEGNHYTYVTADGRQLWGSNHAEPALNLTQEVRIIHHTNARDYQRARRQILYYRARDDSGIERLMCAWCGNDSIGMIPTDLAPARNGLTAHWAEVCSECAPRVSAENEAFARAHGLAPDTVPGLAGVSAKRKDAVA
jgi:hypothetical protein